jgi:hypothetical protein
MQQRFIYFDAVLPRGSFGVTSSRWSLVPRVLVALRIAPDAAVEHVHWAEPKIALYGPWLRIDRRWLSEAAMKRYSKWSRMLLSAAGILGSAYGMGFCLPASAQDQVASIIADQVRTQGFACQNPVVAERLDGESVPNETAYLLKCGAVTYRVVLIPDQAARIMRVD